jgi:thiosulfate/3-mercaptopyruvate sulfurtransferase
MSLVDTNWLEENINNVKIIDCSWHMPQANRNGFEEYLKGTHTECNFF